MGPWALRSGPRPLRRLASGVVAVLALAAWAPAAAQAVSFTAAPGSPFPVGIGPRSVAVGHFNGDSDPDLAVANRLSENVSVLLGDGSGGFAAAPGSPFPVGGLPDSVAVGDFDGDTDADLATANAGEEVSVLLGDGSGGFAPAPDSPIFIGNSPVSIAVGHFNGDSDPDLAVAGFNDSVAILLGDTGASFSEPTTFPAGVAPSSVAVGDFDGDSDSDLAVANGFSDDVSVLLGNGSGSFATAPGSPFAAGDFPRWVAVGDFDGDSDPDLAVANENSDTVSILVGGAGAGFSGPTAFPAGNGPISVAVGEFNGDSDPDLAVANFESDAVSVLLGIAGADFAAAANSPFGAGDGAGSVAVGEFNGDSDPDLAVANRGSANVSVLLGANGYVRPAGASPVRVPLVPAYLVCRAPNRTHGPPLDSPSCAPPTRLSSYLTVGTPDANGQPAGSVGSARLRVVAGDAGTPEDEADVTLQLSVTDVRNAHDLSDYTGELETSVSLRVTDKDLAGIPAEEGTLSDTGLRFTVPCAATGGAAGSTCSVNTTADAVTPGIVKEANRAVWQLGQVRVLDGGEDGLASTADDNTIFMKQGIFVP